ncbi:hypothetical protein IAT38_002855 [Cryptococcus sp. DSM 104549]
MVPYDIAPGAGVGIFRLGDTLWHVLDILRTHKNQYQKVEVSWNPDHPHKSAVTIHLPHITLYFPPSLTQTLTLISLPSIPISNLTLTFQTQVLSSPTQPLTRAQVGRILGPTFASQGSTLEFPGVSFELVHGQGQSRAGRDDAVQGMTISPREGQGETALQGQLTSCVIQPSTGVTITVSGEDPLDIIIGETTSQDLLLDLGPPLRKFWKEDDRLERMWGGTTHPGGCFWNYFQHGIDFLISPEGTVSKILCHSNIPGTPLFQRYARCPWTLSTPSATLDLTSPSSAFRTHLSLSTKYSENLTNPGASPLERDDSPASTASGDSGRSGKKGSKLKPNGKANGKVAEKKEEPEPAAMVLDRVVEGGLEGVIGVGESRLLGFDGLIIEEDQASGGICSILVWRDE